jgi:site-specific DNA recombinase
MREALLVLEERKAKLETGLRDAPASPPRLHPSLAEAYRRKVANLQEALNQPETRPEAAEALRGLIEAIRLVPEDGQLQIELSGDLAAILDLCAGKKLEMKHPRQGMAGVQETLVAGVGFEPTTFRL